MRPKQAERGIALLRIVFGFWLFRSAMLNLIWAPWPWPAAPHVQLVTTQLAQYSLEHPSFWVRYFIQQALLPHANLFVGISLNLQLLAGVLLTFGLLTVLGGLLALLLAFLFGILTYHQGDPSLGYQLFLGAAALVFSVTRAGRRWGFDVFLAGLKPHAWFW